MIVWSGSDGIDNLRRLPSFDSHFARRAEHGCDKILARIGRDRAGLSG
jgi:hypothetical protein